MDSLASRYLNKRNGSNGTKLKGIIFTWILSKTQVHSGKKSLYLVSSGHDRVIFLSCFLDSKKIIHFYSSFLHHHDNDDNSQEQSTATTTI